jgi:predicted DNA binding CopG/RHH family protein
MLALCYRLMKVTRKKRVMIQIDEVDYEAAVTTAKNEGLSFAAFVRRLLKTALKKKTR